METSKILGNAVLNLYNEKINSSSYKIACRKLEDFFPSDMVADITQDEFEIIRQSWHEIACCLVDTVYQLGCLKGFVRMCEKNEVVK